MKPLMAAWTLIGSHRGAHTVEWRRRASEVVVVMTRLVATLLRITTHDDHLEHQLQVLLVLHFYHQLVRVSLTFPWLMSFFSLFIVHFYEGWMMRRELEKIPDYDRLVSQRQGIGRLAQPHLYVWCGWSSLALLFMDINVLLWFCIYGICASWIRMILYR